MSPTSLRALLAVPIVLALAVAAALAPAPPAQALDTRFATVNQSSQPLRLLGTSGNFAATPAASIPAWSSDSWNVIFWLGSDNWAGVRYAIDSTGYQLWLSANPAYGSWPAQTRCTFRDAQGRIVDGAAVGLWCDATSTSVVLRSSRLDVRNDSAQVFLDPDTLQPHGPWWGGPGPALAPGAQHSLTARNWDPVTELVYLLTAEGDGTELSTVSARVGIEKGRTGCTLQSGLDAAAPQPFSCAVQGNQITVQQTGEVAALTVINHSSQDLAALTVPGGTAWISARSRIPVATSGVVLATSGTTVLRYVGGARSDIRIRYSGGVLSCETPPFNGAPQAVGCIVTKNAVVIADR